MAEISSYQRRVLEMQALQDTLLAERDPENIEKRLAAEVSQAKLFDAGVPLSGAITKALLGGNSAVDFTREFLNAAADVRKSSGQTEPTINIDSSGAAIPTITPKRLNMGYPDDSKTDLFA
jgi:hypothetical protein